MVASVFALSFSSSFPSLFLRRPSLCKPKQPPRFSIMAALSDDPICEWILTEGKATQITRIRPIGGGCINHASRYDTDSGSFFVKSNSMKDPSATEMGSRSLW